MLPSLLLVAAAVLAYILFKPELGALKKWALAGALAAAGLKLVSMGQTLFGAIALVGAAACFLPRRTGLATRGSTTPMARSDALEILGLSGSPGEDEIRAAHRRLIARVHPDSGGNARLATDINRARDTLLSQLQRSSHSG